MNELAQKLLKLKPVAKVGVTAAACILLGGLYYVLFYTDLSDQAAALVRTQEQLKQERTSYEKRRTEYLAYRNELLQLQAQQRELLRALPKKQEIPSFMSSVQEQAELAGLEVLTLSIEAETPEDLYVKIPVKMEIRGGYHAITKFFKSVAELRRIVNIEGLSLAPDRGANEPDEGPMRIRAKFIAATFRYNDGPAAGGGT